MTKLIVLQIFAQSRRFMKPDEVWHQLGRRLDRRCLYSYLDRLKKQGLVERNPNPARGKRSSCCGATPYEAVMGDESGVEPNSAWCA